MSVITFVVRNLSPRRLFSVTYLKRTAHISAAWLFKRTLELTGSSAEFHFSPAPHIRINDVLLDFEPSRAGDVQGMDVDGPWEPQDLTFVLERLREGGVFYDIGANIGWYSLNVSLKTPATVVAFEPQPERLRTNLVLNQVTGVRVFPIALGNENGDVRMTAEHKSSNFVTETGPVNVSVRRLDDVISEHELPDPTVLKIDIEGFEYHALRGAEKALRRAKPIILCEITGLTERYGITSERLVSYLESLGYERHEAGCSNCVFVNEDDWGSDKHESTVTSRHGKA